MMSGVRAVTCLFWPPMRKTLAAMQRTAIRTWHRQEPRIGSNALFAFRQGPHIKLNAIFALIVAMALPLIPHHAWALASRFSGGTCSSQGSWVQRAMDQSQILLDALETMRTDPNCKALAEMVIAPTDIAKMSTEHGHPTAFNMAGFFRELQALREGPKQPAYEQGVAPLPPSQFNEIVNYLVFRKGLNTVTSIYPEKNYSSLADPVKAAAEAASSRLGLFLSQASLISKVALKTTKSFLRIRLPHNGG